MPIDHGVSIISQNPCAMVVGVDGGVREDNLSDVLAAGATDVDVGRRLFPSRHPPARRHGMTTDTRSTEARGRTARTSRATLSAADRIPGALKAMVRR